MKRRWIGIAILVAVGVAAVVVIAIDAPRGRTDPAPAAFAAATRAGWEVHPVFRSLRSSGAPWGTAVVEYRFGELEVQGADLLQVRLRRSLLSSQWQVVSIDKIPWVHRTHP